MGFSFQWLMTPFGYRIVFVWLLSVFWSALTGSRLPQLKVVPLTGVFLLPEFLRPDVPHSLIFVKSLTTTSCLLEITSSFLPPLSRTKTVISFFESSASERTIKQSELNFQRHIRVNLLSLSQSAWVHNLSRLICLL